MGSTYPTKNCLLLEIVNQPTLLQRAKQGDDVAIAAVLNYLLKDRNITAKVAIKGDSLLVLLKSVQLPQQESSVAIVDKLMNQLNVESIKIVEVYGKQIGQKSTAWSESLDLMKITKSTKKLNRFEKLSDTGKLKTNEEIASSVPNTNRWPLWFPYPSSWIRALILIPMAFPGARLILSGFGGIILSVIGKDLTLLIFFSLFCILLPTIFIAFIYHFFWFIWKKKIETKKLLWWLPGTKSWRESFYGVFVIGLSFTIILIFVAGFAFLFCKLSHETGVEVARCAGSALGKVANGMFCSIDRFFDSNDSSNIVNDRDNIDIPLWFGLWLIIASYLYQAEYLMRHDIFPKLKGGLVKYPFLNNLIGRNPQKFFKNTVIILLIPLVAVGIYFGSKLPQLNGVNPSLPVASQSPLPKPSPIIESSPIQSPSPISSPQADVFREAVNKAISAAQLTQSAKSKAQWNQVANEWESAIAFMETVPESSPNYAIAQKKAIEYQENLDYAKRAANLAN
ncbi:MAG TPA: hypothetical protein DEG17_23580 [Cyanobacteria bacterium UBA11149]|nr:hypothetical protein [Cyanobacteria bacterium UBA11367]HBE58950.1 hypothetical protein [Cyanobacteria bacterium UBA11366]HBK63347.1 hypothetical protein [Cyanobacteria bacterium UBA11166]HBR73068.1 hypothetical protein [Cyanobacteria bacterium UBA11159]HBS70124.1 hypothetical protein [Cyanobacteria bacterium UBA11153]HBW91764.1 hypothetical protein [Cyanobacteria bacterium UBA11149]HCA95574.1 hypothetical protein [Cyanobacteria bacterium UBA9226]